MKKMSTNIHTTSDHTGNPSAWLGSESSALLHCCTATGAPAMLRLYCPQLHDGTKVGNERGKERLGRDLSS